MTRGDTSLVVAGLAKSYPGLTVLEDLDFTVDAGEVVAVAGTSGTGKSTLLNLIGLMDHPDAGTIHLDGQRLDSLSRRRRALVRGRRMGFVFQAFHLLPEFTVQENVLMAARCAGTLSGEVAAYAGALLDEVGLADRARDAISTLSGGERQRVALCRALLNRPRLLLADEPTGNLDPDTAGIILDQMIGLAREHGSSVIIVTHDPAIAARANRVLDLREGRLHPRCVQTSPPTTAMADETGDR